MQARVIPLINGHAANASPGLTTGAGSPTISLGRRFPASPHTARPAEAGCIADLPSFFFPLDATRKAERIAGEKEGGGLLYDMPLRGTKSRSLPHDAGEANPGMNPTTGSWIVGRRLRHA